MNIVQKCGIVLFYSLGYFQKCGLIFKLNIEFGTQQCASKVNLTRC